MARLKREGIDGQPVRIDHIEIPAGRRAADPKAVAALVESIKAVGLMNPIRLRRVSGLPTLVAGLHRIRAYEALGRETIPSVIVEATDDEAALAEIDENLCRAELSAAEVAGVVARRKAIYERLHPETKAGGDRRSDAARSNPQDADLIAPTFAVDTAAKTGKSRDAIERAARRGSELGEDTLQRIKGTSLDKGVELDALVSMAPEDRSPIVERAEAGETVTARPPKPPRVVSERVKRRQRRDKRETRENIRMAFLLRADTATQLAVYSGSVDKDIIAAAQRAANAWAKVTEEMDPASLTPADAERELLAWLAKFDHLGTDSPLVRGVRRVHEDAAPAKPSTAYERAVATASTRRH